MVTLRNEQGSDDDKEYQMEMMVVLGALMMTMTATSLVFQRVSFSKITIRSK